MNNRVRQAYESVEPDVVIGSQINMAPYVVSLHGVTRILDELETGYLYGQLTQATTSLTRLRATLTWWKIVRYYRELLDALDGYTTVSEIEQRLARDLIKSRTPGVVISNGVEMPRLGDEFPAPERDTLIYCGSPTFSANLDAVRYFTSEILPLVAAERPNVRLYVTGEVPTRKDSLPQFENRVMYTGNLAAVRPLLASCWVSVVPLLKGGGTRLKILESLAVGTPVVSTSKGMEGLALKAEDDLLCADSPADFATSVIRVLENDSLRNELVMRGKEAVAAHYQWSEIFCTFERFVIERNSA
jgi:glycosyltransferase involved in cell wall biosynthesis